VSRPLSWLGVVRLGLVQASLGAIVALTTSTLNRIMVVELALPAVIPAALVAWHYAVQLSRPRWGHGSDVGRRRTPWIVGGIGVLALGALLATNAAAVMQSSVAAGVALSVVAFALIGAGVGAGGTSLLALLATRTAPERRPAAAAVAWILMIVGIVLSAGIGGALLDPFSFQRLSMVASGVALIAFLLTLAAVRGVEGEALEPGGTASPRASFRTALRETLADPEARRFAVFVLVAMVAYSAQDLILEPFAGLVFGLTPGASTQLASVQNLGVLLGMILVGAAGGRIGGGARAAFMRGWTLAGCGGSALALCGLAAAAEVGPGWPLGPTVFLLGFCNGVFAVAAIGSMMGLAGGGGGGREGVRMGVFGAAQAVGFAVGGLLGAAGVDLGRRLFAADGPAFLTVFLLEAGLFLAAAAVVAKVGTAAAAATRISTTAKGVLHDAA
jgi:BCD family chlorophyll transporter-like MFS transporter